MKKLNLIIIILMAVVCFGCKETYCPEFPSNINYFSYNKNQEITFVNSQHEESAYKIVNCENSESWSYKWNCKCECEAISEFRMKQIIDSLDGYSTSVSGRIIIFGGENVTNIEMTVRFSDFSDEYLTKTLYKSKKIFHTKINKFFADTIFIKNNNNELFKKVVIVKNKGLVSYTTADGEEWRLVE